MLQERLVMVGTCEMAGQLRGKGFPLTDLPARMVRGVGWVPTNSMISCFGPIADTPFGTRGDLLLIPDPATETEVDYGDDLPPVHFFLGDLRELNGQPWACCPRDFLRRGLAALERVAGLRLHAAFEQEFVYTGIASGSGGPYGFDSFRAQGRFGHVLMAALRRAGLKPDSFLPEYGDRQFEVTIAPATGLAVADHAVASREIVRATAARLGARAIFSPILDPAGAGNGVHIHFSFRDRHGAPVTHDPAGPFGVSAPAAHFLAGILHHLPALVAVTAPSVVSYLRLTPGRWTPTTASLAVQEREAALRLCPVLTIPGAETTAEQFHLEFRAADAAASPYLALGALVHAGVDGLINQRSLPADHGTAPLPRSLGEALDRLEQTPEAVEWFGPTHLEAYLRHKRAELKMLDGLDAAGCCARYAGVY